MVPSAEVCAASSCAIAAGLLLASLFAGIGGTAWQAVQAGRWCDAAEQATVAARGNYRMALDAFGDMVYTIQDKLKNRADTQDVRKELLNRVQQGLQKLIREAEQTNDGDHTLNWAHMKMGDCFIL